MNSRKILWIDTETTGLDCLRHDPVQIALLIEIDGIIEQEVMLEVQPLDWSTVDQGAVEVTGLTEDVMRGFIAADVGKYALDTILGNYVDKFNKDDKFTPAGYNVRFDLEMLASWYKRQGDNYWGSWCNWYYLDLLPVLYLKRFRGDLDLPNYKLSTVCEHFGIKFDGAAHNALADIKATRELARLILKLWDRSK